MTPEQAMAAHASKTLTVGGHRVCITDPTAEAEKEMYAWPAEERAIASIMARPGEDLTLVRERVRGMLAEWTHEERRAFRAFLGVTNDDQA